MKITNKFALPDPMLRALSQQRKRRDGVISVTEMIQPYQVRRLTQIHDSEIEEDASDRLWALMGSSVHYILMEHVAAADQSEVTLRTPVGDIVLEGTMDLISSFILWDYKLTSVWSVINSGVKPEWEAQLNCYSHLCRRNNIQIDALRVCAILRDWQQSKGAENGYPQCQVKVIDVPMWEPEATSLFIAGRVANHLLCEGKIDEELPPCSPGERWYRPGKYAVMKEGRKSALRLLDSFTEAAEWVVKNAAKEKTQIVERPGRSIRCWGYCNVQPFCHQFKNSIKLKEEPDSEQD